MNVLMISPGFPGEMPHFTRGLARQGATVLGVGDQPAAALPSMARDSLTAYLHIRDFWNEGWVVERIRREIGDRRIDRVECLWEPAMLMAGSIREALGAPGLTRSSTLPFRDKELMKTVLDRAGIRTPWHRRARTSDEVRQAASEAGFPVIVKPIAGAGSTDTYRVDDPAQLERILPALRHVTEVSVEEFIDGDELTYDTVCGNGRVLFENVSFYRHRPIEEKKHEWISPCSICLRDHEPAAVREGIEVGRRVLAALGFETGFTHMEWYRTRDDEIVFGEIGARPPGAHLVDAMNFCADVDLFSGWAEAVCHGRFSQRIRRDHNAAVISKRARGTGRIRSVVGLERLRAELGKALVAVEINPPGTPSGDWRSASVADGYLVVRHPSLHRTIEMVDRISTELHVIAG